MNREQKYLIRLSAAYLTGERFSLESDIDYAALMSEAMRHNLFGVAFCALTQADNAKEIIGADRFERLQGMFTDSIFNSNLLQSVYDTAEAALEGAGIRFAPFKGIVIKEYYPVPETRAMGDADLLIDLKNRTAARKALEAAGFKCQNSNGPVWDYDKNGVRCEVHTRILNGRIGSTRATEYFENAIEKAEFNGLEGRFDDDYHFEYLIAHLAHHFCFYGAGIRMVLDLAVMLKFRNIDIDRVIRELDTCGLGEFARAMLTVCHEWYGCGRDYGTDTQKAQDFLACHGAFGTSNRNAAAVMKRRELEDGKSAGTFKTRFRLLFPPYERLKEIPYIKFIENRPYLTPLAWIYRFFYNLKNRRSFMLGTVKHLSDNSSYSEAEEELEFLKGIGLG